ncbi:FGGY family carbohydrate kinase [Kribbella hippodromi]|uniref:FGGY family carbohydrate kinase n=1 Tax=Kribbella hippodromi TaxID=434347 RepID=UPI003CD0BD96
MLGWQDARTAEWCRQLPASGDDLVRRRTGLRVDAMFSAPKLRWLLDRTSDASAGTAFGWHCRQLAGSSPDWLP